MTAVLHASDSSTQVPAEQYRKRIEYEDQLLYVRFNIVMVVNGFAAVASGFTQPLLARIVLTAVLLILNALGAIAIWKTEAVIAALSARYQAEHPNHPIESIVQQSLGTPHWLRPNRILCRMFPPVIALGWAVGLVPIHRN